ncbi:MAG TPA: O-antigen ligase family protein [Candidatus Binatia bacterium]|nr:O-antigen ligase family protein [Candidatus Binatia bacterium]
MNLLKPILRIGSRFQEIEFTLLLAWGLLFPAKESYSYYFGFTALLVLFSLKKILLLKNIPFMRFSVFVLLFNAMLITSAFFSPYPGRSILFSADILLLSVWFFLLDIEAIDVHRYLRLMAAVISLASLLIVIGSLFQDNRIPVGTVFKNPILQGIVGGMAVLFYLHALLQRFAAADLALLLLNLGAVVVSASKAAFLGVALFAAAMIMARKKKWIAYFAVLVLLLALVPNPLRRMVDRSLRRDPYVLTRLNIWNLSARMFRLHPWTGVGPDLFAAAARRFNFPQDNAPARYAKQAESPHSDYWKVITENGLAGLVFVLLFVFFAIRRMLAPPWSDAPRLLLAFLMTQMLFFNFVFNSFFLLVFLFLLYSFFWRRLLFVSPSPVFKALLSGMLLLIFVLFYLLPLRADRLLHRAAEEKNVVQRFALLNRAAVSAPLDVRVPLAKAQVLSGFFRASASLEAWEAAREELQRAQKLDRTNSQALIAEAELFAAVLEKGIVYPALAEEILTPLRRAAALEPFNPFLKLQQGLILVRFERKSEARRLVLAALELEPEYVAALVFLRRLDGLPAAAAAFRERIARIQAKAKSLHIEPGSYLDDLYRMPLTDGAAY